MRHWALAASAIALILSSGLCLTPVPAQALEVVGARAREVLPATARPERYVIELTPDIAALTFSAKARLTFQVLQPTNRITVNAAELTFVKAGQADGGPGARVEVEPDLERVSFIFDRPLELGEHAIEVDYAGKINDDATGLFVSRYQEGGQPKAMLVSQFEAGYARRMAPIWDEPGLKAAFELALVTPDNLDAVSNMPVASVAPAGAGMKRVTFQPSPKMSSYLMFVGLGEMDRITTTTAGVEIGSVTRRGAGEQGRYALGALSQILPYYNDYFGTPYPLPKLDQIAVPGAGTFGAMENWGAILYFEGLMLVDPALTTAADKQRAYVVVAHEVAHQWFGHRVQVANVEGASVIVESLTKYSELLVVERLRGRDHVRQLLEIELDQYLAGRAAAPYPEVPLYKADSQPYLYYNKAAVVLLGIRDLLGQDTLDRAIRALMQERRPTSLDLVRHLNAVADAGQRALIQSWMKEIDLYDLRVETARASRRADGRYDVEVRIDAGRSRTDARGVETPVALDEPIEIAFASDERVLDSRKHRLRSGTNEVRLVLDAQPDLVTVDPWITRIDRSPSAREMRF